MTNSDIKNPRAKHDFVGRTCSISAVGSYVPEKVLSNAELEKLVETNDEWIVSRTGIRERRMAADDEITSDMAAKAATIALERAKVDPSDVDLIILATITPDMPFPAKNCCRVDPHLQKKLDFCEVFQCFGLFGMFWDVLNVLESFGKKN